MARIKKWTPVIVYWKDAVTIHESANSEVPNLPASRVSIGFCLRKNRDGITICMEDDRNAESGDDNDCQTVTTIPTGMTARVVQLVPLEKEVPVAKEVKPGNPGPPSPQ